jgi:uncharacterized membrane protein
MAKTKKMSARNEEDNKLFAFLATFLSIVGFLIAILTKKNNEYVMFYAKQSLVVFIFSVIASIVNSIVIWIPIIGWAITRIVSLLVFMAWIFSWICSLSGQKKEVPVIGKYARKFNF